MEFTIREKNPGPKVTIVKNGEVVLESGAPQTPEQEILAKGTEEPKK
jgi:hypothetical protein